MKTITYFLFIIIVLVSCSTDPEFKRNNENDIASSSYIPDISELKLVISADKSVTLRWEDNSTNETGSIIWKKLGEEGEILLLDEVPTNTETYTDTSGKLDLKTRYFISAYTEGGAEVSPTSTNTLSALLDLGTLSEVSRTAHRNEITLRWDTSNIFADKYLIQHSTFDVSTIDTIDGSLSSYTFMENAEDYVRSYQVSALLQSHSGSYDVIDVLKYENVTFNLPTNLQVNIINEAQALVTFEDGSDFDDQFIIYERYKRGGCCNHTYSEYHVLDTLDSVSDTVFISKSALSNREYSIAGIYNGGRSTRTSPAEKEVHFDYPIYFENEAGKVFTVLSDNSLEINWITKPNTSPEIYHLELYIYDNDTDELLRTIILPPDATSLLLNDIDTSVPYRIEFSSYQQMISSKLVLHYSKSIIESDRVRFSTNSGIRGLKYYPDSDQFAFTTYNIGLKGIRTFNLNSETVSIIPDGSDSGADISNGYLYSFITNIDLSLFATFRSITSDNDGSRSNWILVNEQSGNSNNYIRVQAQGEYYTDEVSPLGFLSDSELLYLVHSPEDHQNDLTQIYKWNFVKNTQELLLELEIGTVYKYFLDRKNKLILLIFDEQLYKIDYSGNILSTVPMQCGGSNDTFPSSISGLFYLNCSSSLYSYSTISDTFSKISDFNNFYSLVEIPEHNILLTYFRNTLAILEMDTWNKLSLISDFNNDMEFRQGFSLSNKDQVLLHINGKGTIYNITSTWIGYFD